MTLLEEDPPVPADLAYASAEPKAEDKGGATRTEKPCTEPGCKATWVRKKGDHPRRSKCDEHYLRAGANKADPEPGPRNIEDLLTVPLSAAEREIAARLELLLRVTGGAVYRLNVVDGLIVGHHAAGLAEAMVIEARTSAGLAKMVQSMAAFSGAGPLALVLGSMLTEIAANHRVPVIGDLAQVPPQVRADAERITALRNARAASAPPPPPSRPADGVHVAPSQVFGTCASCERRVAGLAGAKVACLCGAAVQL